MIINHSPLIRENIYGEQLQKCIEAEILPGQYNGKQYTTYEALQQQRKMERVMRAQRQRIKLLEEGGADKQDIILGKGQVPGTDADL